MAVTININSKAVVAFTNKLEKMRKSDLPLAIRGTLNKAAFNVKQVSMPHSAETHFEKRKPNFFKANSKVQMANGFEVKSMRSVVGFVSTNLEYNNYAVQELEQQEHGGYIPRRSFVPTDEARAGGSHSKPVRPNTRLKSIRNIVKASDMSGSSRRQKFIKAALKAGKGGFVLAGLRKPMLYMIQGIERENGRTVITKKAIYSYQDGRAVKIGSTSFMREATLNSASRLERYFIEEAKRRILKASP